MSLLGDQIALLALPLVAVLVLDAGPGQMGLLGAAALLPHLLFSLPAGVWLDRVASRRRVMIAADLGRAALVATIPLAYALDALTLAQLYAVAFLAGIAGRALRPLVPDALRLAGAPRALHRGELARPREPLRSPRSRAPRSAACSCRRSARRSRCSADAVSFLVSALFLGRVRAEEPPIEHEDEHGLRDRVAAGLRFIGGNPIFRPTLTAVATLNFFNYAFQALFVLYATGRSASRRDAGARARRRGASAAVLGAVVAGRVGRASASGAPSSSAACSSRRRWSSSRWPRARGGSSSACSSLAEFLSGLGVMILDINVGSIMFALTPDRLRSRATGAFNFVNWGIRPLGALAGGALGAWIGVRPTLWVGDDRGARRRALAPAVARCRACASCPRRPRDRRPLARRARAGASARSRSAPSTASTAATGR